MIFFGKGHIHPPNIIQVSIWSQTKIKSTGTPKSIGHFPNNHLLRIRKKDLFVFQ